MWSVLVPHLSIAISGLSGCGNSTVSKLLADTLQLNFVNFTFRNLAEEAQVSFDEIRKMAEIDDKWDRLVDKRQVDLASKESSVIGSRLAIWMLADASLKVYLEASEAVRVSRIHKREGGDSAHILTYTRDRDMADVKRYKYLYNIDITRYEEVADMIINVDNIYPPDIVAQIVQALEKKQLIVKED